MHKGMISYKLANIGWDVSEHFGDGFDLVATKTQNNKSHLIKIELKAVDLLSYAKNATGFSQAISANEIVAATHLIISIFEGINSKGHFIMSIEQAFNAKKKTKKFVRFKNFQKYREDTAQAVQTKINNRKGNKDVTVRLSIDIGCTLNKYKQEKWDFETFRDKWENLTK